MSASQKRDPKTRASRRRLQAIHRIVKLISHALGPFKPNEMLMFNSRKGLRGLSTLEITQDKHGRFRITPRGKQGFFERLYAELPRTLQRRFFLLEEGPAPSIRQYRKMEREILGRARLKLRRELMGRINRMLPRHTGHNGGLSADEEERREIRKRVRKLMQSGNEGEPMSKRKAIETVAAEKKFSARHVWRIVLGH